MTTVVLQIGGCPTSIELGRVGSALQCIRGVARVEPAADGRHVTVSYDADRVVPLQLERAVRAMEATMDRIEAYAPSCLPVADDISEESTC
jgi:hypothetical protein